MPGGSLLATPAMSGGLFAIGAKWWRMVGEYDMGMKIWGGENIEFSVRIWACGGKIFVVPCSRIGHVFRSVWFPYVWPEGQGKTVFKNKLRFIRVRDLDFFFFFDLV